jgi:hypothetical protein
VEWLARLASNCARVLLLPAAGCSLAASACSTVEPGEDFDIADVVYDENFFYCRIENNVLFAKSCGPGDPAQGDSGGGCHFNVTSFRLSDYAPRVGDTCNGLIPTQAPPAAARNNYTVASRHMALDPDLAALLNRPTGKTSHPRVIFDRASPEADLIREWATKFSTQ